MVAMVVFAAVAMVWGSFLAGGAWRAAAARFPVPGRRLPAEEVFRFVTLRMMGGILGTMVYRNCVRLELNERGLLLSVWGPFGLGHPPMLIPWDAIETCERDFTPWGDAARISIGDRGGLLVHGPAGKAILASLTENG